MKRVMLYFGSFNPVHKGHIALAEYVVEQGLCDEAVLVVSPQSPYKRAAELAPEMDRFEMAERACAASRLPERIKPSVVEFLLPTPSYTIDTLRSEVERIWAKGNIIVFDVDVIGGINLKRIFGGDACSIFVMPPSVEELRRRLEGRGTDAPEVIDRRVAKAEFELTKAPEFDHVVVNDSLDEAIRETTAIIDQFIARQP